MSAATRSRARRTDRRGRKLGFEPLEDRTTPAAAFGLIGNGTTLIRFDTNDPDIGNYELNLTGFVTGTAPPGAPVITVSGNPAATYNFTSLPRPISPAATVTDSNSANFNGGILRAAQFAGRHHLHGGGDFARRFHARDAIFEVF